MNKGIECILKSFLEVIAIIVMIEGMIINSFIVTMMGVTLFILYKYGFDEEK